MSAARLERILHLMHLLHSGRSFSADALADEVGVARRTLFRYLDLLGQAGVALSFDRRKNRYRIRGSMVPAALSLTIEECRALLFVTRKMLDRDQLPDRRAARRAALKLEASLPPALRDQCAGVLSRLDYRPPPAAPVDGLQDHLAELRQAIEDRRVVWVRYEPHHGPPTEDRFHPYHMAFINRGWYAVGLSERAAEVRTLKIERMAGCRMLDHTFDLERPFDLDAYLGNAWQMIRGAPRCRVIIRFSPKVASGVEEVLWHKTQRSYREPDDSLIFEVDVDGIGEIAWWILGYGDDAEVLEPESLRRRLYHKARRMCRQYRPVRRRTPSAPGGGAVSQP